MGISTGSRINFTEYRWDLANEPEWIFSDIISGPSSGGVVFSYNVPNKDTGKILGYFLSSTESNVFVLKTLESAGSTIYVESKIYMSSNGSVFKIFNSSLKDIYYTTSGTIFSICIVVENVGSFGSLYQAGVLIGY